MRLLMSRQRIYWLAALGILLVFQYLIVDKERTLSGGDTVLLRLVPVDPRSLMQGDYMQLDFALGREIAAAASREAPTGFAVIRRENGEGRFVRIDDGSPLTPQEYRLRYAVGNGFGRSVVRPDSFFFQEGQARAYEAARFGVFQCAAGGECLLTGLAGEDGRLIEPGKP